MTLQEFKELQHKKEKRYCEICGGLVGIMSIAAFNNGHRHCNQDGCVAKCTACQATESDDSWSFEPSNDYLNF